MFAIIMDLMHDWRNTPGSLQLLPFLDEYLPVYGYVALARRAAVLKGSLGWRLVRGEGWGAKGEGQKKRGGSGTA